MLVRFPRCGLPSLADGSIPGPYYPVFDGQMGDSWQISPLTDEEQPDGMIATNAVERFVNFSRDGIGKAGGKRFFHAVGFHKPHLPHIVPQKYYDMYELGSISLPPNPNVPVGMKAENWRYDGNVEMGGYGNNPAFQNTSEFGFEKPLPDQKQRELRRGYFAATSFLDAQAGRVLDALTENGFKDNTVVVLWSDHGWYENCDIAFAADTGLQHRENADCNLTRSGSNFRPSFF